MAFDNPTDSGSTGGSVDSGTSVSSGTGSQVGDPGQGGSGGASPVDLTDDTPVRWPGEANPIKYGDLQRRLQADHTRKTQQAAKLQKQLAAERARFQQEQKAERARLESMAAAIAGRQGQQGQQGQPAWMTELSKKDYLTGADAAALMGAIQNQGFGSVAKAFEQRDKILQTMYQLVQRQQAALNALQGTHQESAFEGKITKALQQIGRDPADYRDIAKEIYLAYEGDDLDDEFPEILRNRLEQIEKAIQRRQAQSVNQARQPKFPFPGKGGAGSAPKGAGLTGREGSLETADRLWELLGGDSQT